VNILESQTGAET